jgi:hypothetical protein
MTSPDQNILNEIGRQYEGGLTCIGVVERPSILLMDEKGQRTVFAIGSHGYMNLRPRKEAPDA